jgi:hypothetical protein
MTNSSSPDSGINFFQPTQTRLVDIIVPKTTVERTLQKTEEKLHILPVEHTSAIKSDTGKTQWDLMPFEAVEEINKVLEFGAIKYAAHNWKVNSGFKWTRLFNSLLRHLFAWIRGEDNDPESGLSHLSHAGCNILFLIYYSKHKDRFTKDDRE